MPELCPGCFEADRPTGNAACRTCGYSPDQDRLPLSLPIETELKGRYLAGRVLGEPGGFGVTYLGYDRLQGEKVAIKEYMPREMAGRDTDGHSVVPHSGQGSEEFEYGKEQFMEEAQTLARFDHANIVGVRDFFEANGTAYLVMEYYKGKTLDAYLAEVPEGRMAPEAATEVMLRVLDGLKEMHREGYLHRDVKPENIYLTEDGRPILIDFGAARQALGERSRSLSVVMTPGYAPYEQYRRDGDQGPYTDVYGCGATLYRMVTGQKPPPATDRIVDDTLEVPRRVNPTVPEGLSEAIVEALAPGNKERISSAEVLQERLQAGLRTEGEETSSPEQSPAREQRTRDRVPRQRGSTQDASTSDQSPKEEEGSSTEQSPSGRRESRDRTPRQQRSTQDASTSDQSPKRARVSASKGRLKPVHSKGAEINPIGVVVVFVLFVVVVTAVNSCGGARAETRAQVEETASQTAPETASEAEVRLQYREAARYCEQSTKNEKVQNTLKAARAVRTVRSPIQVVRGNVKINSVAVSSSNDWTVIRHSENTAKGPSVSTA